MAELTVVPNTISELGKEQSNFDNAPVSLTLTSDCTQETFTLRTFFPKWESFFPEVCSTLLTMFENTEEEERQFYRWVILMARFYYIYPELDGRRARHFDISTFDHSETLRNLTETAQSKSLSKPERLLRFVEETSAPTIRLLQEAIYIKPDLAIPLSQPDYQQFREQVLSEMMWVNEQIEEIQRKAIKEWKRKVESNKKISRHKKTWLLERLDTLEAGKCSVNMWETTLLMEREVLKGVLKVEDEKSSQFTDVAEEARTLTDAIGYEVEEQGIKMLSDDGVSFSPEYAACIHRYLDTKTANRLLWKTIERYEQVFKIEPIRDIDMTGLEKVLDDSTSPETEALAAQITPSELTEFQQYLGLWSAYQSEDLFDKWYMVSWIAANLVNRNECLRLLQREAESVYHSVLDYGFKQEYRKLRHLLTRAERRAYALMFFRLPIFDYHVAVMDPVISSFYSGMDEETQGLILLVLVFKVHEWQENKNLDKELERRWRAYLRFYPYWVEIIQGDDREAKRQKSSEAKMLSLEHVIAKDENGNNLTLSNILPDVKSQPANLLQAIVLSSKPRLEEWAKKYCTSRQARHVLEVSEGKTEIEIAKIDGVSQQAVSKSVRGAIKRIRSGLIHDGVLEQNHC
jgi:DNA-binding CsgD family transcriptional regulator